MCLVTLKQQHLNFFDENKYYFLHEAKSKSFLITHNKSEGGDFELNELRVSLLKELVK